MNLFVHVPKDHVFNSHCGRGNGLSPGNPGHSSKNKAAEPTPEIASAPSLLPTRQLGTETRTMFSFVREEVFELGHHVWRSPPGKPLLRQVNADGAVLARVIDFDHAVAKRLGCI